MSSPTLIFTTSSDDLQQIILPRNAQKVRVGLGVFHPAHQALLSTIDKSETHTGLADADILSYCWEIFEADQLARIKDQDCDAVSPMSRDNGGLLVSNSTRIFRSEDLKAIDSSILDACWKVSDSVSAQSLSKVLQIESLHSLSDSDYLNSRLSRASLLIADMVTRRSERNRSEVEVIKRVVNGAGQKCRDETLNAPGGPRSSVRICSH